MLKFGTDGWRGLIARDFTYENLQIVALATARYIKKHLNDINPAVVLGYDTRFLSRQFAEEVAKVFAHNKITINLTNNFTSTPEVSFHTKMKNACLGIVITASHNPPEYNGFKVKAEYGGPASQEQINLLEIELKKILARPPKIELKDLQHYIDNKYIRLFDAKDSYIRYIKKKIKIPVIKNANLKILFDPMHGAGINIFNKILPEIEQIHTELNPTFGTIDHPEPIAECLGELISKMKTGNYDIGVATDGDADRLGLVDNEGNFVDSHRIFMILMKYLYEKKRKRGAVVKTVSLTSMVNKYCKDKDIKLYETPVGFKYTAKKMSEENILIGGEESGGLGTSIHIPERDGIFNSLLVLEAIATYGKSLKQLCDELDDEFGPHRFLRKDVRVSEVQKDIILSAAKRGVRKLGRYPVIETSTLDGYKFFIEGGWLLIRASGTEPLIRFYAEAESYNKVSELIDEGMKLQ